MAWPRAVFACLWTFGLAVVGVPTPAQALEISGGVSVGGVLIGADPRLAVSPHAGLLWRLQSGAAISVHDAFNILPAANKLGVGVYNQTSVAVGYAWDAGDLRIGPSLSLYSMPACAAALCGRVVGLAPGGQAQMSLYFAGPVGVSVSANLDWITGSSLVLPSGVAATVIAGPVFRWSQR